MPRFGSQQDVARALEMTTRRVQQLQADHILPPVGLNGRYDIDLSRERYRLYAQGTAREWDDFHTEMQRLTVEADVLVNEGPGQAKTLDEIKAASGKLQDVFGMLRFSLMCHKRQDDFARQCMMDKFNAMENEGLGRLASRVLHILAEKNGISFEQALAGIQAQEDGLDVVEFTNAGSGAEEPPAPSRQQRRAARRGSRR
ncbi:hypothetical protein LRS73_18010 [Methylobacterium currus]|uniref:hypothetical protein n=1 Tax=Methylobacterium currus TaxID=2051553 RepID=UPI001E5CB707|nr:hypothetical protein [Methylobacterium currus]UHC14443.1 hypothetical protein LRS73_18010 [Methylobacterium currus]